MARRVVPRSTRRGAGLAARDRLRPVARHPLPHRPRALARSRSSPSRRSSSIPASTTTAWCACTRSTPSGVHEVRVLARPLRLRAQRVREPRAAGARLRGLPAALPAQAPRLQGRADRLPRRELLPRARQGARLRPLGARPRHRHGAAERRGVPVLPRVLAGAPAARRARAGDLRAARQPERDGRLPLRGAARRSRP